MQTIVIEAKNCPTCGKPMPAAAPEGLCPACLLAQGAQADTREGKGARFEPPPLEEIRKLFPQLEIISLLGAGGMGAVYKARQPALDRLVALKILPIANTPEVNFTERFNREARALARLSHPNIVALYEFGVAGGLHHFVMEYVDGANLRQLEQAGRLSPREALQIVPQICDALQYAHDEGVVHRDIKPENVLIDRKGRVKIADFGLAKIAGRDGDSARLTLEGQVMGTPHYMAPEQVERPLSVDHRADIYALGVVFYEMLTGDLPLGKFAPPSRKVELDIRLDDIVLRALENDPKRRYQKASDVKTQVETVASTTAPAGAESPAPPMIDSKRIRWWGIPILLERDGNRVVDRIGALKAFGLAFGVLTIVFGLVTAATGKSLFGWAGIVGWQSVVARLILSAMLLAWGLWLSFRRSWDHDLRRGPDGTVILTPPRPWWRNKNLATAILVAFAWLYVQEHFLTPYLRKVNQKNQRTETAQVTNVDPNSENPLTADFWKDTEELVRQTLQTEKANEAPINRESVGILPSPGAGKGNPDATAPAATLPAVNEAPQLRFVAWQDEWKRIGPKAVRHPDGTAVNPDEVALLAAVHPVSLDVTEQETETNKFRVASFWLSHPMFEQQTFGQLELLDHAGAKIELPAQGAFGQSGLDATSQRGGVGWLTYALSPGESNRTPRDITVHLRYAIGPLRHLRRVPPDYNGGMSLYGNSQLSSIGQSASGKAFVAIAVDAKGSEGQHFVVRGIDKMGKARKLVGSGISGNVRSGVRAERFEFDIPLAEVSHFEIGTIPIRTIEWHNVVLTPQ